jgi:hypothetical protein
MAIELVPKTSGSNPLQVRVLHPPPDFQVRTLEFARLFDPSSELCGGSNLVTCKSIRTSKTGDHIGVSF